MCQEGMDPRRQGKKMKIGTKVSVKTKHYGTQTGTIIAKNEWCAKESWRVKPDNHPRNIAALPQNIKVIR